MTATAPASKPYSGPGDGSLPAAVRKMSPKKKRQWVAIFNDVLKRYGDESRAFAAAYSGVKSLERLDELIKHYPGGHSHNQQLHGNRYGGRGTSRSGLFVLDKPGQPARFEPTRTVRKLSAEFLRLEEEIRDDPYETAVIQYPDGRIETVKGDKTSVAFSSETLRAIRGAALTHNHPMTANNIMPPSAQDVATAMRSQVAEMRIVTPLRTYSIKPPRGGWEKMKMPVLTAMQTARTPDVSRVDVFQGEDLFESHWAEHSKQAGYIYSSEPYAPSQKSRVKAANPPMPEPTPQPEPTIELDGPIRSDEEWQEWLRKLETMFDDEDDKHYPGGHDHNQQLHGNRFGRLRTALAGTYSRNLSRTLQNKLGDGAIVDFSGMDNATAKDLLAEMNELATEWPEVARTIDYVGADANYHGPNADEIMAAQANPHSRAVTATGDQVGYGRNVIAFQASMTKESITRDLMAEDNTSIPLNDPADSVKVVATHEFGHAIVNKLNADGMLDVEALQEAIPSPIHAMQVSLYAASDPGEAIAEMFAAQKYAIPEVANLDMVRQVNQILRIEKTLGSEGLLIPVGAKARRWVFGFDPKKLTLSKPPPSAKAQKELDALTNPAFWRAYRAELKRVAEPIFKAAFDAGVETVYELVADGKAFGTKQDASSLLTPELNRAYAAELADYVEEFLDYMEESLRDDLQDVINESAAYGYGADTLHRELLAILDKQLSPARAQMIATTETTRIYGLGAQASYKAMGLKEWEWSTAADDRVDPHCITLSGQKFSMNTPFEPAHPRCRCWPSPVPLEGIKHYPGGHSHNQMLHGRRFGRSRFGAVYGRGAGPTVGLAERNIARAAVAEPAVTADMQRIAAETGGEMVGLQFRLKTITSLQDKIRRDALEKGISEEEAASQIRDNLRYTTAFPQNRYTEGVRIAKARMTELGYRETVNKNVWNDPSYKGINTTWIDPRTGIEFEMQYHTQASYHAKQLNHELYKEWQKQTSVNRRMELFAEMERNQSQVPIPAGALTIR